MVGCLNHYPFVSAQARGAGIFDFQNNMEDKAFSLRFATKEVDGAFSRRGESKLDFAPWTLRIADLNYVDIWNLEVD